MVDRISVVGRWNDVWFMDLPPYSKLLFDYLCDNCSSSGFIEINYKLIEVHTGLTKEQIKNALIDCRKNLLSDKKSKIWVKTHLFWQQMLPLNKSVPEHRLIIAHLEKNLPKFNMAIEITEILNNVIDDTPISAGKNGVKRFVPPTYEEFSEYFREQKPDANKERIDSLYNHYVSVGWSIGNKQMKDWQAAIRKNMNRNGYNGHSVKSGEKVKSRTQTTMEVVGSIKVNE